MARLYQSRQLLDPSFLSNRIAMDQLKLAQLNKANEYLFGGINSGVESLNKAGGQLIDWGINKGEQNRRAKMFDMENLSPDEKAIGEEYVRTGDPTKLLTLRQIKEANEARKAQLEETKFLTLLQIKEANEARKAQLEEAKLERMKNETMHKRVALAQVRPVYEEIQNKMFDAIDAGDFETASIQKSKLEAIETEFGSESFGQSAASVMENRKKTKEEKDAALVDEETKRLAKQGQESYSLKARTKIESNVLPNMKTIVDKGNYKKMVTSMWQNGRLTDEDAKALLSKIENTKTLGEKVTEASDEAVASAAGDKTKKDIEDTKNKNAAQEYNGKKMSNLEWDSLDENIRKHLYRDASGIVRIK